MFCHLNSRFGGVTFVFALLGAAGCSRGDGEATYPVAGTVRVNGKPAASALVVFHPIAGLSGTARPTGRVEADGTFALTTREGADGAPAGEYRVTIVWTQAVAGKKAVSDGDDVPVRSLLPATYAKPESTPLKATVHARTNEPITFEIKTTGR
ncbi:MAG TPA: hypothetical protein VM533_01175 [Fimbriiglobus sp.]|jgi:hypothetical protein|nr:hypothetical protein [Fimbriiglobus sp.]